MGYCQNNENKLKKYISNKYYFCKWQILISLEFTTNKNLIVDRYVTIHCNSILYYKYEVNVCHSCLFEKLLTIIDIFSHCCLKSKTFLVKHTS